MLSDTVKSIYPFVPAKDFATSVQFYKDLGFSCVGEDADVQAMKLGDHFGFLLQNYYVEAWANNFMLDLHVTDVHAWHQHILALNLTEKYPGVKVSAPKLEDWGMIVMHLIDPSGVLWHITQWPESK